MSIHLHSASQRHLVVALTTLSTTEIHLVPYKYTREAFLQFPTLAGESPKSGGQVEYIMGTSDLPEIYALALGLRPRARTYISSKSLVPMLQLLHI